MGQNSSFQSNVLSQAIRDYHNGKSTEPLYVYTDFSKTEEWDVSYFFRTYEAMPLIEKQALDLCRGMTLDIGAGTGVHTSILSNKGHIVHAMESSPFLAGLLNEKGFNQVFETDFFLSEPLYHYDTLLLLMNGIGISKSLDGLRQFFSHAKKFLKADGQMLFDSADLSYLLGQAGLEARMQETYRYYGEVKYWMAYKNQISEPIHWLYADPEILQQIGKANGFDVEILIREAMGHFLARCTFA